MRCCKYGRTNHLNLTFAFVGLKASFVKILSSSHKLSYDVAKAVRKNENAILRICLCCCGSAHRIKVLTPKMLPLLLWTQKKTWIEFCNFWSCVFKYSSKTRIEFYNYSLRGSHQSRKKKLLSTEIWTTVAHFTNNYWAFNLVFRYFVFCFIFPFKVQQTTNYNNFLYKKMKRKINTQI